MTKKILRLIGILVLIGIAGVVLVQLIPFGKEHTNPPVVREPQWDSPATRDLAKRACFDCHSNETAWPWYSNVAPVSWLLAIDVLGGREALNLSEWQPGSAELEEVAGAVVSGSMPPPQYTMMHRAARLTGAEREQLAVGLLKSLQ